MRFKFGPIGQKIYSQLLTCANRRFISLEFSDKPNQPNDCAKVGKAFWKGWQKSSCNLKVAFCFLFFFFLDKHWGFAVFFVLLIVFPAKKKKTTNVLQWKIRWVCQLWSLLQQVTQFDLWIARRYILNSSLPIIGGQRTALGGEAVAPKRQNKTKLDVFEDSSEAFQSRPPLPVLLKIVNIVTVCGCLSIFVR